MGRAEVIEKLSWKDSVNPALAETVIDQMESSDVQMTEQNGEIIWNDVMENLHTLVENAIKYNPRLTR